jgi:hypothetical protein
MVSTIELVESKVGVPETVEAGDHERNRPKLARFARLARHQGSYLVIGVASLNPAIHCIIPLAIEESEVEMVLSEGRWEHW